MSEKTKLVKTMQCDLPLKEDTPFIVAIGASAGGLETLKTFFSDSVPNINIAFVIITHLCPDHVSLLPELIQKHTPIKVLPISNHQKVLANHIYVLPPGKKVGIHQGVLELINQEKTTKANLPIDFFLCSLAKDQSSKVICVILSGMGHDGSLGLRTIREEGGLIISQTVKSALYDGMPKSAINTGLVDYILEPGEMYAFVLKYVAHLNDRTIPIQQNISEELQQILAFIKNQTGHDFSLYKPSTIFRRIQKRLTTLQIKTLSDFINYLHNHPGEIDILFKELLINVTHFFRDPEAFELLKNELLEKTLINKSKNDFIRVWIPGCSTGEEVYSIAITLYECMSILKIRPQVQIFGTDIDADAIQIARTGIYPERIKENISPERLQRFFTYENGHYIVNQEIRKMIIFAVQNITNDPPFTKIDLLSCRNLLIYLSPKLQKKILPLFHYSLNNNGLLFLGTSETLGASADYFKVINKKWRIFERNQIETTLTSISQFSYNGPLVEKIPIKKMEKNMSGTESNLSNLVKDMLLKYYTPCSVVIDEKGTIIYVLGHTSKFLEFAPGEAKLLFIDMIQPQLKSRVYSAIREALTQQKEVFLNNLQLKRNDGIKNINIKIRPIMSIESAKNKLLLIIFEENTQAPLQQAQATESNDEKTNLLEQELNYTKENLHSTIQELETINEELKSSNEELQSTNEELQSTNEEIETSKEELQSLNEELTTVNTELENRIEQLSSANDDIKNLLDNTDIATIFLDKSLRIKRFTPKATEIINLISSDVGRPVSDIVSNISYETLIDDARSVLKTLIPISTEGVDKNGLWYVIRIIPYRTVANVIDGVVITFLNIHSHKNI